MIILDTNIISALMQAAPQRVVIDWLDRQPPESVWTTSINVFEVVYGLRCLPQGKRRSALQTAFEEALREDFQGRILDFDVSSAREAAAISSRLRSLGRPVDVRDTLIAGITAARSGVLATRNTRHFVDAGISLIDPWQQD